jgi:hypothetical protein
MGSVGDMFIRSAMLALALSAAAGTRSVLLAALRLRLRRTPHRT